MPDRPPATVLLALLVAACGAPDADATPDFAARDSAGVTITESSGPAWAAGEEWRVAAAPSVEIGMADGPPEYLLSGVVSAVRRSDGTIILVNGGAQEIRFYDAEGRHLRTVGRRGDGPGEFQQLFWIQLIRGDSIVAYDFPAKRLTVLDPDGAFVRTVTLGDRESFPHALPALSDGSAVVQVHAQDEDSAGDGVRYDTSILLHVGSSGEVLDTVVVEAPIAEYRRSVSGADFTASTSMRVLFGPSTLTAVAADRLIVGRSDSYQLRVYDPVRGLERLVRRNLGPRGVTEELLAAEDRRVQERLAEMPPSPGRDLFESVNAGRPHAETLPFFSRVMGDEEGRLWVQGFAAAEEPPPPWSVFDVDGRYLGDVTLPERFTPRQFGPDYVLGVVRDELDVERVRVYPLEK